jgi:hypothetical protein
MPHPGKPPETLDELLDIVLRELAAGHPRLTAEQQAGMKARLFAIMVDAEGSERDPDEMARLFHTAIDAC